MTPRIGSLFTGYGGLDLAVEQWFGARAVWTSDIDPGASKIIAHRMPDAPNLGDLTLVDWSTVEPIEILTGGFPCQDVSTAGKRAGLKPSTRSGLWSHMAYAIDQLRPRYVVAENVRGLLSAEAHSDLEPCPWCVGDPAHREPDLRALGAVLGDLAGLGYDARWIGLRAADVGAPHGRFRVFVVATDTRGGGWERGRPAGVGGSCDPAAGRGGAAADAGGQRYGGGQDGRGVGPVDGPSEGEARERQRARGVAGDRGSAAAADPQGDRRDEGRAESTGLVGRPHAAVGGDAAPDTECGGRVGGPREPVRIAVERAAAAGGREGTREAAADPDGEGRGLDERIEPGMGSRRDADRRSAVSWGPYGPAVARWEAVTGRLAPAPTETGPKGAQRLSPRFVEWMMGLPAGWVTDVPDLSRNAQLKALGNGVVPLQALEGLRRALS